MSRQSYLVAYIESLHSQSSCLDCVSQCADNQYHCLYHLSVWLDCVSECLDGPFMCLFRLSVLVFDILSGFLGFLVSVLGCPSRYMEKVETGA